MTYADTRVTDIPNIRAWFSWTVNYNKPGYPWAKTMCRLLFFWRFYCCLPSHEAVWKWSMYAVCVCVCGVCLCVSGFTRLRLCFFYWILCSRLFVVVFLKFNCVPTHVPAYSNFASWSWKVKAQTRQSLNRFTNFTVRRMRTSLRGCHYRVHYSSYNLFRSSTFNYDTKLITRSQSMLDGLPRNARSVARQHSAIILLPYIALMRSAYKSDVSCSFSYYTSSFAAMIFEWFFHEKKTISWLKLRSKCQIFKIKIFQLTKIEKRIRSHSFWKKRDFGGLKNW